MNVFVAVMADKPVSLLPNGLHKLHHDCLICGASGSGVIDLFRESSFFLLTFQTNLFWMSCEQDFWTKYLADQHEKTILKIRFVLSPFSFVFLLKGEEHFHLILETLDTEEATYTWYFNADKRKLPGILKLIDEYLNTIRNKGRQAYLENAPVNFSRVHHDYSDDKKGFITWKDSLEERLI